MLILIKGFFQGKKNPENQVIEVFKSQCSSKAMSLLDAHLSVSANLLH